jgi:cytochrome bd-type quinol oxidase subunit 2
MSYLDYLLVYKRIISDILSPAMKNLYILVTRTVIIEFSFKSEVARGIAASSVGTGIGMCSMYYSPIVQ